MIRKTRLEVREDIRNLTSKRVFIKKNRIISFSVIRENQHIL